MGAPRLQEKYEEILGFMYEAGPKVNELCLKWYEDAWSVMLSCIFIISKFLFDDGYTF